LFTDFVFLYQVANKLYPLSYISQEIEEFATKMLHSVLEVKSSTQDGGKEPIGDDVLMPQTEQVLFFCMWDLHIILIKWKVLCLAQDMLLMLYGFCSI
jgi:hypothetical protein